MEQKSQRKRKALIGLLVMAILLASSFALLSAQRKPEEDKKWSFYPITVRNDGDAIENAAVEVRLNLSGISGTLNFFSQPDPFAANVLESTNMTEIGGGVWSFTVRVPHIPANSTITIYYGVLE